MIWQTKRSYLSFDRDSEADKSPIKLCFIFQSFNPSFDGRHFDIQGQKKKKRGTEEEEKKKGLRRPQTTTTVRSQEEEEERRRQRQQQRP